MRLKTELKELMNSKIFLICLVFLLAYIFIFQIGINYYKDQIYQCDKFKELEQVRLNKSIDDISNGLRGLLVFNSLTKPSPLSSLFQYSIVGNLHSTYDNLGIMLDNSVKFSKIPVKQIDICFDVARYVTIIFSLLVSLLGLFSFRKKYIKYQMNFAKTFKLYFNTFLSRFYLVLAVVLSIAIITVLWFRINGIKLSYFEIKYLAFYFLIVLIFMSLFLFFGFLGSLTRNFFKGVMLTSSLWLIFVFLLPGLFNSILNSIVSKMDSTYVIESKKFHIVRDFDQFVQNKFKNSEKSERKGLFKELNKQFLNQEFGKIKKLEQEMINNYKLAISKIQFYKIFSPASFHSSLACELSSLGYVSYLNFHNNILKNQDRMVDFYFNKPFNNNYTISDMDVIFNSRSILPNHFFTGLTFSLILALIFLVTLYFTFKKSVFPSIKYDFDNVKITARKGDYIFIYVSNELENFSCKLFNILFSNDDNSSNILVDGKDIKNKKVFYLPDLAEKKLNSFKDLSSLIPNLKAYDVLLIDNLNYDHNIEANENITIIELNSKHSDRKRNASYFISLNKPSTSFSSKKL